MLMSHQNIWPHKIGNILEHQYQRCQAEVTGPLFWAHFYVFICKDKGQFIIYDLVSRGGRGGLKTIAKTIKTDFTLDIFQQKQHRSDKFEYENDRTLKDDIKIKYYPTLQFG